MTESPPSPPRYVRALSRLTRGTQVRNQSWEADTEYALLNQEPLRARRLMYLAMLAVAALLWWAAYAEMDEIARGEGRVIPSSKLQVVQAVDGGVVESIKVRVGDVVQAGQLLMQIDTTRFASNLGESRSRSTYLEVRAARLRAMLSGQDFSVPTSLRQQAPDIVSSEEEAYRAQRLELSAQVAGAKQEIQQRQREIQEARARRDQAKQTLSLVRQELAVTRPLLRSGAVSEVEILRLEREEARLVGERDQAIAQILRVQSAYTQAERKVDQILSQSNNQLQEELTETLAELQSLNQSSAALEDRVDRAIIRSPVRGTVKQVLVNTVGGVVQPGSELMEIVPLDDTLILETKIRPRDIGFLRPGQPAVVKFSAYDFAIFGGMQGEVQQIAADSVVAEDGSAHYLARIRTFSPELAEGMPIIPGMLAEVDIVTGKKSLLQYLFKPVLRARHTAFTER